MGSASLASEFPNDNAEISGGSIWVCHDLIGPASLVVPPFEPVVNEPFVFWFEEEDGFCEGPIEIEATTQGPRIAIATTVELAAKGAVSQEPLQVSPAQNAAPAELVADTEPFVETNSTTRHDADAPVVLESEPDLAPAFAHFERALVTALLAQGASRSAAILPKVLRLEPIPGDALSKDVQLTLQSRGYTDGNGRYSLKFRDLCGAWGAVLRGDSSDFAACGTTTLDRFGADLLSALLAVPASRADELRRELRKHGVAAFGILEAA